MSTITYQVTINLRQGGCIRAEYESDQFAYLSREDIHRAVVERVKRDLELSSLSDMTCEIDEWAALRRG